MGFLPESPKFFDLFEELSSSVIKIALLLPGNRQKKVDWKKLSVPFYKREKKADNLCHKILQEADMTFIAPIDREDIQALAKNLDNVIDLIENAISHMSVYKVGREPTEFYEFCDVIINAARQLDHLISDLKQKGRNTKEIKRHVMTIHSLENKGDSLLNKALKHLFANGAKPIDVIKWKDIYENLEQVLDECEDTSDTVETIIVKNF